MTHPSADQLDAAHATVRDHLRKKHGLAFFAEESQVEIDWAEVRDRVDDGELPDALINDTINSAIQHLCREARETAEAGARLVTVGRVGGDEWEFARTSIKGEEQIRESVLESTQTGRPVAHFYDEHDRELFLAVEPGMYIIVQEAPDA